MASIDPRATTTVAAVIGDPVRHSLSPVIMNAAFAAADLDWVYVAFEVTEERLAGAVGGLRALRIGGASVTMPHKQAVVDLVDRVDDDVEALGAADCLWWDDGRLVASSTDGEGFVASLRDADVDPSGLRTVVLGAGGAARAVIRSLARAGASEVAVVNRTRVRADAAAHLAGAVGRVAQPQEVQRAQLVVNATSVGMADTPASGLVPLDPALLNDGQVVVDLVYHPRMTPLLEAADAVGARTVGGRGMLLHQGALAFEHWTGQAAPLGAMAAVLEDR